MTLVWSRTFPDTTHDFAAEEDGAPVGRIYRHRYGGASADTWFWTLTGAHRGRQEIGQTEGDLATRAEAIAALAAAWDRAKAWSARTGQPLVWQGRVYAEGADERT